MREDTIDSSYLSLTFGRKIRHMCDDRADIASPAHAVTLCFIAICLGLDDVPILYDGYKQSNFAPS